MAKNVSRVKSIHIDKFRALDDVSIEFGDRITIISGKNGTAKSSILGIVAQVFNFIRDYTKDQSLSYKTLTGEPYKSYPSEHFRLSKIYDKSGSMSTQIFMYDGYTCQDADMKLRIYNYIDRPDPRAVVRGNKTIPGKNTSWNPTHPVIYLSLKRLTPITFREAYKPYDLEYLEANKDKFISLNRELLNKKGTSRATATTGTFNSAVAYGDNYDQESVSAGEDNAGQILLSLMSFMKLKDEYPDYKGGLLLIDEADAGLFPAAQIALIKILTRECKKLDLQVIMTSHSPTMIEELHRLSSLDPGNYKTIYLSDTHGKIERYQDISWVDIHADLLTKTVEVDEGLYLPKVNVYFEDKEAVDLFNSIVTKRAVKKVLTQLKEVNLGCCQYISLIQAKIPEFNRNSLIVLDADATQAVGFETVALLPGDIPPDQLLFEFLYNLPDGHSFWKNRMRFTKPVFRAAAHSIVVRLALPEGVICLRKIISNIPASNKQQPPLREMFKSFYKNADIQKMLAGKSAENPLRLWVSLNKSQCDKFLEVFIDKLKSTLILGYGVDSAKLLVLDECKPKHREA